MAVRLKTIMQTVLRTGIDVDALIERGSPRVRELGLITKAYKAELLKDNLIDRAELLWAAAHCEPEPRFLFIYGHHRARKERSSSSMRSQAEGSTFYLPCHGDGIFTGNRGVGGTARHVWLANCRQHCGFSANDRSDARSKLYQSNKITVRQ
ncbi:MAG: hypothetical protein IPG67_16870 [Acidobacteria bacterium]|nr:hypothetical protein [Acidobacteriota bacterium]